MKKIRQAGPGIVEFEREGKIRCDVLIGREKYRTDLIELPYSLNGAILWLQFCGYVFSFTSARWVLPEILNS